MAVIIMPAPCKARTARCFPKPMPFMFTSQVVNPRDLACTLQKHCECHSVSGSHEQMHALNLQGNAVT